MKIGHTGITWGIPGDVEAAYRDTAELGYLGFETFAFIIIDWNQKPGGYQALCRALRDPDQRRLLLQGVDRPRQGRAGPRRCPHEADAAREAGATPLVLQGGKRPEGGHRRGA